MENPWKTLSSRVAYSNPFFSVREDIVIRPDGQQGVYGVVELPVSVGIVAINTADEVMLVHQWRYVHGRTSTEIPTGGGSSSDTDTLGAAARELREETGITAGHWTPLGSIDNSNGATTDVAHMYLATDLEYGSSDQDPEEKIEVSWLSFKEVLDRVMSGRITESVSVAAILKTALLRQQQDVSDPH